MSAGQSTPVWQWQRLIHPADELKWRIQLTGVDPQNIAVISRGELMRSRLTVYSHRREAAAELKKKYGGRLSHLRPARWRKDQESAAPITIGSSLVVVENVRSKKEVARRFPDAKALVIPAGMAFGSGSHVTTGMILREMARVKNWNKKRALDLGTGSGILSLAARQLGARRVVAIDNDRVAIRVARENERRNFARGKILWRTADLTRWRSKEKFAVVTANLYSELLCRCARQIWAATAPGGRVILSGILAQQERDVREAWRKLCVAEPIVRRRKGRWIMLIYAKNA